MPNFKIGQKKAKTNQYNSLSRPVGGDRQPQLKQTEVRRRQLQTEDNLDATFGYTRHTSANSRTGFIFNTRETFMLVGDQSTPSGGVEYSAIEMYCLQEDGSTFKTTYIYNPYFLIKIKDDQLLPELEEWLGRYFEGTILGVEEVWKEDLNLPNHLSGKKQRYIKIIFRTNSELYGARREINRLIENNQRSQANSQQYYSLQGLRMVDSSLDINRADGTYARTGAQLSSSNTGTGTTDMELAREQETLAKIHGDKRPSHERVADCIIELREFDVPYMQRISIDTQLRCGLWYDFYTESGGTTSCSFKPRKDLESRPQMRILAYDIETCKAPLKFPNSEFDQVMMISLMLDGQGLLITNRQIVSEDIENFEYTPKPEYDGPFTIINAANEKGCLEAFLDYIKKTRPQVIVTYNGDFFDWPFVDARCKKYGISLQDELAITVQQDLMSAEYKGRFIVHLDAFCWVQRDSYLPQGSQGLKAVTKAKLKYDPIEVDPEDMMPFARTKPKILAQYSVSDAVATYYLYMKYVHLFIFSLCTIIPLTPAEVLRKGSGTLCETLLMVQAYEHNVVAPNKQQEEQLKFHKGHLLESETYVGGHVECLHSGVYRSDIPIKFELRTSKLKELMDSLDSVLTFAIEKEWKKKVEDVSNYQEIRDKIFSQLEHLHNNPVSYITPFIYHLDVGAMYPNIILTNRLQPYAMVDETICATCDYNIPNALCKRTLEWTWRGKHFVAKKQDYTSIRASLQFEPVSKADKEKFGIPLNTSANLQDLLPAQQADLIKARIKDFSRKAYGRLTDENLETRHATTCQREHPFYIDTVRAFRDRRYLYKELNKTWGNNLDLARKAKDALREQQCKDMILLYDSMQLAHKCILNSFYGYVMRKGSRWSSMPMAGVVTRTGAKLIQRAEDLVSGVGKVLELDTDGIWCVLPCNFPENFTLKHASGGSFKMSFPCSVLNHQVDDKHTNHQYHVVPDDYWKSEDNKAGRPPKYEIVSECSIFFEVDGPYKAMVLPASQHEGKNIKKRYAVFHLDGSLAELKGFEIKRRGELKLIKVFQEDVFKVFLLGKDLIECYAHVGAAANKWLDVLQSRGQDLEDSVVFDLISENKSMSERLEDYGAARSTSITCARRLGEFLGPEMVKDKGLNCHFVIVKYPLGAPVSERAVPIKIWDSPDQVKRYYLKRWLNDNGMTDFDIRTLLDWEYYTTRLNSAIQKIITIPAAFQEVVNPVPRVIHPDWLQKALRKKSEPPDKNILEMFQQHARKVLKNAQNDQNGQNGTTTTTTTTTTTATNKVGFFKGLGGAETKHRSIFDQFDAEENDIEDFNQNHKGKLHPAFKRAATAKKVVSLDEDGNEIDDGSTTTTTTTTTTTATTARPRPRRSRDHQDDEIDYGNEDWDLEDQNDQNGQNGIDDMDEADIVPGSRRDLMRVQAQWIREARARRAARLRNRDGDVSTAKLVEGVAKQIQAEIRRELGIESTTHTFKATHSDEELSASDDSDSDSGNNSKGSRKKKNKGKNGKNAGKGRGIDDDDDDEELLSAEGLVEKMQRDKAQSQSQATGLHKTWHIISIQPHPVNLGVFNAWVNVEYNRSVYDAVLKESRIQNDFKLKKIDFTVDRIIYVHSSVPSPHLASFGILTPSKILPRGVTAKYLYQINFDEVTWQRDCQDILAHFYSDPSILGVYQHDLSLLFKTIVGIGNMVQGLDEDAVVFDPISKKPSKRVWKLESDLLSRCNLTSNQPQINPTRYLITPQEIHRAGIDGKLATGTASTAPGTKMVSNPHQLPSISPVFIFHRESADNYLHPTSTTPQSQLDRQRVFFAVFDPSKLTVVIIAAGRGGNAYKEQVSKISSTSQIATHTCLFSDHTHEIFIRWFVASHLKSYYQALGEREVLMLETSDVNVTMEVLLKKLKIETHYSENPKDAYTQLSNWLSNRSIDDHLPFLPVINTTQDMAMITSMLYHQQGMMKSSSFPNHSLLLNNSFNPDYSLSFIIQSYPYVYTHHLRQSLSTPDSSSSNPPALNSNPDDPFSALNWIKANIESSYANISDLYVDYTRRLHWSRLIKVPICNIPSDLSLYVIDILFARSLTDHHHLIWNNKSAIVDAQSQYLTTTNVDLNLVASFSQLASSGQLYGPQGSNSSTNQVSNSTELELLNPSLMNPGCYRYMCFDLNLEDFTLNALLNYSHLPDQAESDTLVSIHGSGNADGAATAGGKTTTVISTDPSGNLFKIFRTLLVALSEQRSQLRIRQSRHELEVQLFSRGIEHGDVDPIHQREFAQLDKKQRQLKMQHLISNHADTSAHLHHVEMLINNIYRYITQSQYSILYDHLLHVYIHKILKKTLIIMIKELSKLHTTIIYASFERLILGTDKTHEEVAVNRLQSVMMYLRSLPLFGKLVFEPRVVYYALIFMDVYNYAGIIKKQPLEHEVQVTYDTASGAGANQADFDNLAVLMPHDMDADSQDEFYTDPRIKQHEQDWDKLQVEKKFQEQLQITTGGGGVGRFGHNSQKLPKTKHSKLSLDQSDSDISDGDDGNYEDGGDGVRDDMVVVDVDGSHLAKKRHQQRFESLISDMQMDFGQLSQRSTVRGSASNSGSGSRFEDLDTLPIEDVVSDDEMYRDDEIDNHDVIFSKNSKRDRNDNNNNDSDDHLSVHLNDPMSPIKSKQRGHERNNQEDQQERARKAAALEERAKKREAKYAKMRQEMDEEADENDYELEQTARANRLDRRLEEGGFDGYDEIEGIDEDAVELDAEEFRRNKHRGKNGQSGQNDHIYHSLEGFFDDNNNRGGHRKDQKYDHKGRSKESIAKAIAVTESGFDFDLDDHQHSNFDPESGSTPHTTTTLGTQYYSQDDSNENELWGVDQQWNIATFLPSYAEELFHAMLKSFLLDPFGAFSSVEEAELDHTDSSSASQLGGEDEGITSNVNDGNANKTNQLIKTMEPKKRHAWYRENLARHVEFDILPLVLERISDLRSSQDEHIRQLRSRALLQQKKLQQQLQQHKGQSGGETGGLLTQVTNINDDDAFPLRPGKHLHMSNVALEFVKLFCHVLSLDSYIVETALQLKATCLKKLQVQPFTTLSHYHQPCRTFVLPNVCCRRCGNTKDTDLCRDASLFRLGGHGQHSGPSHNPESDSLFGIHDPHAHDGNTKWACSACHHPYNKAEIEARLIAIAQQSIQQYQQQDVICPSCRQMKSETLSSDCPSCTVKYALSQTYRQQQQQFVSLYYIAKQHRFPFLEQMLQWVLSHK